MTTMTPGAGARKRQNQQAGELAFTKKSNKTGFERLGRAPEADSRIEGGGHDEGPRAVKRRRHHKRVVPGERPADTGASLDYFIVLCPARAGCDVSQSHRTRASEHGGSIPPREAAAEAAEGAERRREASQSFTRPSSEAVASVEPLTQTLKEGAECGWGHC